METRRILLDLDKGFIWKTGNNLAVKGYAFTPEGKFLREEALLRHLLKGANGEKEFVQLLKELNGVFSFVYEGIRETLLYTDKSRFFPLFFRLVPGVAISDDPEKLLAPQDHLNDHAFEEFRYTGYTTGSDTLFQEILQVPPGELVTIGPDRDMVRTRIFSYQVRACELRHDHDPVAAMAVFIEKAAERLVLSIGEATPVLPLSGGYDSRLIACLLKARGYSNTICFTYGRRTKETEISRKVAGHLGFKWYFVDYETLPGDWFSLHDEVFKKYYHYAAGFTSMFYLLEFPAMLYLMQQGLIPDSSVFLPGHSGDLLGGSQFTKAFPVQLSHKNVIRHLLREKFINFPYNRKSFGVFHGRLRNQLDLNNRFLAYSIFEDWDIREKIAKLIINSSRVFTYFGYEVRLFYWDDELVEFFRRLPPAAKNFKKMYNRCLEEYFFSGHGVKFSDDLMLGPYEIRLQRLKNFIKPLLPGFIRRHYILKNDWGCYDKFTSGMLAEINPAVRKRLPCRGFNSVIINWYLQKILMR
jgi:asparagine synthase (glutamine-hydrolysing)